MNSFFAAALWMCVAPIVAPVFGKPPLSKEERQARHQERIRAGKGQIEQANRTIKNAPEGSAQRQQAEQDKKDAYDEIRRTADEDRGDAKLQGAAGEAHLQTGDNQTGFNYGLRAIAADKNDPVGYVTAGSAAQLAGHYSVARVFAKKALTLEPTNQAAMAVLKLSQGPDLGKLSLPKGFEALEAAGGAAGSLPETTPGAVAGQPARGPSASGGQITQQAPAGGGAQRYSEGVSVVDGSAGDKAAAQKLVKQALSEVKLDPRAAVKTLEEAARLDPANAAAQLGLAEAKYLAGAARAEIEAHLMRAANLQPALSGLKWDDFVAELTAKGLAAPAERSAAAAAGGSAEASWLNAWPKLARKDNPRFLAAVAGLLVLGAGLGLFVWRKLKDRAAVSYDEA